ncbi:hypothetical protein ACFY8C_03805 [Streptomyces flavochromogenes]|uniref:Ferrous iron transporter FeoA domain-containing protein n=1 Tax=Streptomyces flavochromogenes TaxID=68199 RepID=A0ABW6XIZ7_9ACTN|nr:hypothetical protein [Streptomyces flavochromogenes]
MKTTTGAIDIAQEEVAELREALARAGIRLPSLGPDVVTLAADPPRPLVALGRCTVETARLHAAAVLPGEENRS